MRRSIRLFGLLLVLLPINTQSMNYCSGSIVFLVLIYIEVLSNTIMFILQIFPKVLDYQVNQVLTPRPFASPSCSLTLRGAGNCRQEIGFPGGGTADSEMKSREVFILVSRMPLQQLL